MSQKGENATIRTEFLRELTACSANAGTAARKSSVLRRPLRLHCRYINIFVRSFRHAFMISSLLRATH